jgi:hypothetical protein
VCTPRLGATLRILPLLALAGCQFYWTKPSATLADFTRDHRACVREVGVPITREANRDILFIYEDAYKSCLEARGWQRVRDGSRLTAPGLFRGIEDNELVRDDSVPRQVPWGSPSL